jgi:hypothetical protein
MPKNTSRVSVKFNAFEEGTKPNASGTVMTTDTFDMAVASMRAKVGTRLEVSTVVRGEKLSGPVLRGLEVVGELGSRKAIALVEFDSKTADQLLPKSNRKLAAIAVTRTVGR